MSGTTATGRPTTPMPLVPRLALVFGLLLVFFEALLRLMSSGLLSRTAKVLVRWLEPALHLYVVARTWVLAHPLTTAALAALGTVVVVLAVRSWLLFWHNQVVARLTGSYFHAADDRFPALPFDVLEAIRLRPPTTTFVGMSPKRRRFFGWRWEPVYLTARQRSMHRHVLGKTGSGKTQSVLFPQVFQDALDGKGILVMDAKGSDENILTMKAIARATGREKELKVFALPAWNQPQLPTHAYNMIYVRPRTPTDPGGDPIATAERVFSVLPLGDNEYYNTQAQIMWVNLCRLLHGMVDARGFGLPFTMNDLAVCFKGIGNSGAWSAALDHCLQNSLDQPAAREVESQISRLERDVHKAFSGVVGAIDKFLAPMVTAYDPDLVFEQVLQTNEIVYVQLPANLFPIQAPAMGKVMLMDVQQEGSLRQVFRQTRNQAPFSVVVDEFYNFADIAIVDSLNKLRDAHLEYTLAHQSVADLELVSKEFAVAVWDNTRTKDVLSQDNPELCEKLAKSIGTHSIIEKTVRQQQGALFTSLITGDASTKLVDTYLLHPNQIKHLASSGQGYLYHLDGLEPVSYAMLPSSFSSQEGNFPLELKDQSKARGLRLYDTFIRPRSAVPASPSPISPAPPRPSSSHGVPPPAPAHRGAWPAGVRRIPTNLDDVRVQASATWSAPEPSPSSPPAAVTHFSKRRSRR